MSHMRKVQNWDDGGAFTLLERQVPTLALLPCFAPSLQKGGFGRAICRSNRCPIGCLVSQA